MDKLDDSMEVTEQENIANDILSLEKSQLSTSFQGKYPKQAYRKAWEDLPDFKGWLQEVDGQPSRAYCSYCRVTLFAHRLSLLKHTCTMKHQRASQKVWLLNNKAKSVVDETVKNTVPEPSDGEIRPIANNELNLQGLKVQQNLPSGMTVTIVQEGIDGALKLQIGEKSTETEGDTLIGDDDLVLNDPPIVHVQLEEEKESSTVTHAPAVQPVARPVVMAHSPDYPLSTHVLDTSKGQPVAQLSVSLYRLIDGKWTLVNEGITSQDGRCNKLIEKSEFVAGRYKLHFDTDRYFELERKETLYPFVEIAFDVHAPQDHYHIPLLLSAYGYSTYRGS